VKKLMYFLCFNHDHFSVMFYMLQYRAIVTGLMFSLSKVDVFYVYDVPDTAFIFEAILCHARV
jgi:hypothetical protein